MPARVAQRKKTKKSPYVRDDKLELCNVARALRSFVKGIVPGVKETVNAWGIPTFEKKALSVSTWWARTMRRLDSTSALRCPIQRVCSKAPGKTSGT
jgi:hypothetical protein